MKNIFWFFCFFFLLISIDARAMQRPKQSISGIVCRGNAKVVQISTGQGEDQHIGNVVADSIDLTQSSSGNQDIKNLDAETNAKVSQLPAFSSAQLRPIMAAHADKLVKEAQPTIESHPATAEVLATQENNPLIEKFTISISQADIDKLSITNVNGDISIYEVPQVDPMFKDPIAIKVTKQAASLEDLEKINIYRSNPTSGEFAWRTSVPKTVFGSKVDYLVEIPALAAAIFKVLSCTQGNISIINSKGDVDARSISGKIEISNLQGDVISAAGNNTDIIVQGIAGFVKAVTANGRMDFADIKGYLDATSQSAKITAKSIKGKVKTRSESGQTKLTDVGYKSLDSFSQSGNLIVVLSSNVDQLTNDTIEIESGNGDIKLTLPAKIAARLMVNREMGDFISVLPLKNRKKDPKNTRNFTAELSEITESQKVPLITLISKAGDVELLTHP